PAAQTPAIYGFAIGAGFAAIENVYYLVSIRDANMFLWILRGFGTAVMHGGTTCILGILSKSITERQSSEKLHYFLPGLIVAVLIHAFFNHLFLDPRIITAAQLIVLPGLIAVIFSKSENALRDWLEVGMDTDVCVLEYIISGRIIETKIGKYLLSLKSQFPGEVMADLLCFLRIHLELAVRAKGILLLKGTGFSVPHDPEIQEKFAELKYLENSIGKTGKLALSPILHTTTRDLWQIYLIKGK
ncbi:MAG: PrsW family glutamic-type intramembrane protease, partial [bacterium]